MIVCNVAIYKGSAHFYEHPETICNIESNIIHIETKLLIHKPKCAVYRTFIKVGVSSPCSINSPRYVSSPFINTHLVYWLSLFTIFQGFSEKI